MNQVIEKNRSTGNCSGCGVCTVVCPQKCLIIQENEYGELRPSFTMKECIKCGRCLNVCPFSDHEYMIDSCPEKCYIGYSEEFIKNGSSGGVATWFLYRLLDDNSVDAIVCVGQGDSNNSLFTYRVCRNKSDLIACQGSAYYPVTLSGALEQIRREDGRVAVVGVPCFITALRNLKQQSKKWDRKIKLLIGLVCGHLPNKTMTDVLAWSQGYHREKIDSVRFRTHNDDKPAWDYGVRFSFKDGNEFASYGSEDFGYLFWHRLFSQKCCNDCTDVFAEQADITFMDAWLPEYSELHHGTSMIICRSGFCESVLAQLMELKTLEETSIEKATQAQKKLVDYKRNAGKHQDEIKLQNKVKAICIKHKGEKNIIDYIRRACYKDRLKKDNKLLWIITETKDRIMRR